ncbi:protein PFC0760c-like isoform X1 [Vespula maculifrons]|uniref:Protein PFC0760c-like isoform X1 n=1 Tax=Vespula maculifrons TaxID=7453 RepID=A0ABD2CCM7_VESMC
MEEEKVSLNNNSNCTILSLSSGLNNVYESLNKKYETSLTKLVCNNQKQKKGKSYFSDDSDSTKYLWEDISKENIKCNAEERNIRLTDSNCMKNTNTTDFVENKNVPLRVLIRQMLDEAFGKPCNVTNVNEDRIDLQNTNDNKINSKRSSLMLMREDSIDSKNKTNNSSSSNETSLDCVKYIDNKLISIEEESVNFSSNHNTIEYTGMYLSRLLKFEGKSTERIKNNDIASLEDDNDNSTNNAKFNKDFLRSSVLHDIDENEEKECDDSLHCMNFMKTKLPVNREINIENKFVTKIQSIINSSNNLNFNSSEEKTTDFFNISNNENTVEKKEMFHKRSNLSKRKETKEISLTDDNSIDIDQSTKNKSKFTSKITINLQKSYKRQRQSITLFQIKLSKRTPKLSMNTSNKSTKTIIPHNNVVLEKKLIKHTNISSTNVSNTKKTTKIPKVQQNRAKLFKSREINKKKQMIPQLILTPASPENRD